MLLQELTDIPDVTFSYFVINLPDFKTLIYYIVHQTTVSIDTRQTNIVHKQAFSDILSRIQLHIIFLS